MENLITNSVSICFRLNYLMAGLSPMWYHATNVALHAAACILVTRVSLVVAALRPGFAALAGLLFAAHPVHTEAVSHTYTIFECSEKKSIGFPSSSFPKEQIPFRSLFLNFKI